MDGQSLGSRNAEISRLIKTLTNLSNVNGYHRSDSVSVMLVIILIGQLKRHACVLVYARAVVANFAEFFFMKTYNCCLVSFSNFVIVLISYKDNVMSFNSVLNSTRG